MLGIYKITSPSNKIYIGQSMDIKNRWGRYEKLDCKTQPKLYNSLKKYGVNNHTFQIIFEGETESLLNEKERYYQEFFDVIGKNGLNCRLTETTDRSGNFSSESIKRMSEAQKNRSAETKRKISVANKGHVISQETRKKISQALKNPSLETRIKMSAGQKGKIKTGEHKRKIKEAVLLKVQSDEYKKNTLIGRYISYVKNNCFAFQELFNIQ